MAEMVPKPTKARWWPKISMVFAVAWMSPSNATPAAAALKSSRLRVISLMSISLFDAWATTPVQREGTRGKRSNESTRGARPQKTVALHVANLLYDRCEASMQTQTTSKTFYRVHGCAAASQEFNRK